MKEIKVKKNKSLDKNTFRCNNNNTIKNDFNKITFLSFGNNNNNEKINFNNIFDNPLSRNNFPLTNNTSEHNYYINYSKTMAKMNKSQSKIKKNTYYINNLIYKRNNSDSRRSRNKNLNPINLKLIYSFKNKKERFNKSKNHFFPSLNYLDPEIKKSYESLVNKTKKSLLFMEEKDLNIDSQIENLDKTKYITNKTFCNKRYNSTCQQIYSYDSNKRQNYNLPFLENKTIYKGLNNLKIKFSNPIDKARIKSLLTNFHQLIKINKFKNV